MALREARTLQLPECVAEGPSGPPPGVQGSLQAPRVFFLSTLHSNNAPNKALLGRAPKPAQPHG